jgi:3-ketosteroid 9alpha-monooxygenase subunit A
MDFDRGWYCLAFVEEVPEGLSRHDLGDIRLMILREGERVTAYPADCPHRGAHLGCGGRLEGGGVVCPYHGYRIRLDGEGPLSLAPLQTLVAGGAVYVLLGQGPDDGWPATLARLGEHFDISPGITMHLSAPMEEVVENGFDQMHFASVHRLSVSPFEVRETVGGALEVTSSFQSIGRGGVTNTAAYRATLVSPGLIAVEIGGDTPYGVITGAVPNGHHRSTARLSFILPRKLEPAARGCQHDALRLYSHRGLSDDDAVWKHVNRDRPPMWTAHDASIRRFYGFCERFRRARRTEPSTA